jgi:hypothetical protein
MTLRKRPTIWERDPAEEIREIERRFASNKKGPAAHHQMRSDLWWLLMHVDRLTRQLATDEEFRIARDLVRGTSAAGPTDEGERDERTDQAR